MAGRSTSIAAGYDGRAVTPSDTVMLTNGTCRALYVGVTGNITALMASGNVVLFSNVPVGVFQIQAQRINSTATTATNLVALY
jgi:hypothetical protein